MVAVVLHVEGGWYAFDKGTLISLPAYPVLNQATLVVTDFPGANAGVLALDDKPAFAEAVIERQLRREGQVDGECKVLIHQQVNIGEGFQALYTAVPIDLWQRMLNWSRQQADHCLIVPLASLLWRKLPSGKGLVLRTGQRLIFCAREQNRLLYATTVVFSDKLSDMRDAVNMLATRVNEQQRAQGDSLSIGWCVLNGTDAGDEQALVDQFAERSGLSVSLQAPDVLLSNSGERRLVTLPYLLSKASALDAINPLPARIAFLSEGALPLLAAGSLVMSIGLALLGSFWMAKALHVNGQAQELAHSAVQLNEQSAALMAANPPQPLAAQASQMVSRLRAVEQLSDPYGELAMIRTAAAGGVRILRVRSGEDTSGRFLRVEGVTTQSDQQLADFLQRLRAAGYEVVAQDAADNSQPARFFSYQLNRLGART